MRVSTLVICVITFFVVAPALAAPVALFDQAHGQRFVIEQSGELHLSGLAETFNNAGFEVRSTREELTADKLQGVAVVISSGGFAPHSPEEIDALADFVEGGGNLAVMLHIAPTYTGLLRKFGVMASGGVIHETQNVSGVKSLDFKVTTLRDHPLFDGIDSFMLYGGWALLADGKASRDVALTSKEAWVDMDGNKMRHPTSEPLHTYSVVVAGARGGGNFAVFGDDAIFQDRFLEENNRALARNLARWFGGR